MAAPALFSRSGGRSAVGTISRPPVFSPASLLAELAAEYPEISTPALAHALDRATVAADALGTAGTAERIAVLARDRLDAAQVRAAATARRGTPPAADPGRDLR